MTEPGRSAEEELRRLRWRCRRGLLENDLVLVRFLDRHAEQLDAAGRAAFNELLDYEDNHLWDLISGRAEPSEARHREILGWLREPY